MNIAFVSNYMNHHQLPLCLSLCDCTDDHFTFIATSEVPNDRLALGYHNMNKEYPFVLCAYESKENYEKAMQIAYDVDVLIIGNWEHKYGVKRKTAGKLTFEYLERLYKEGIWHVFSPQMILHMIYNHTRFLNKNVYALCASAYTAWDLSLTSSYINKTYKWGYFPEINQYEKNKLLDTKNQNKIMSILWCGRLISLKHPETCIALAERLKNDGYQFIMNIIGIGDMEKELKQLAFERNLNDQLSFLGSLSPEDVRIHMIHSDVFLFTSDYNEGWGAVLNESMNAGCAVIASHAIGSVPYLLKNGVNGLIYKNGDLDDLYRKIVMLFNDRKKMRQMGLNAYDTMLNEWNPRLAAERLVQISENLLNRKKTYFQSGPCSRAERISQYSMYKYCIRKREK